MAARKGNLMGIRHDIRVLDATIRDGGLCNNFAFSDDFYLFLKSNWGKICNCTCEDA